MPSVKDKATGWSHVYQVPEKSLRIKKKIACNHGKPLPGDHILIPMN